MFTRPGPLYAIVEIKGKPFYIAPNDILMPHRLSGLSPGDSLSLDRVREIGSQTHILKGNPYIHPDYYSIRANVLDHYKSKEIGLIQALIRYSEREKDEKRKESHRQESYSSYQYEDL